MQGVSPGHEESDFFLFQPEGKTSGGKYQKTSSESVKRIFLQLLYVWKSMDGLIG